MEQNIVLVDDDRNILTSVSIALEAAGFRVCCHSDGAKALQSLSVNSADLAILDIKMPRMDGMELLRRIREISSMPVIFLTSKEDEIDEVLGLRMGAEDYITKPFSQRLLLERIQVVLRRERVLQERQEKGFGSGGPIVRGALTLDVSRHLCVWKGQQINLTVTEFLILGALAQRLGHVKNRDQLMDVAYGNSVYVDDRTIDSHIKRLRKKFRDVDPEFSQIETLYGIGYRYKE